MKPPCKCKSGAHPARLLLTVVATWLVFAGFQQEAAAGQKTAWRQDAPKVAKGSAKAVTEIRAFMDEYLRLHAATLLQIARTSLGGIGQMLAGEIQRSTGIEPCSR